MPKPIISDDAQLDTKARDYCGSERHERLWFSMSPVGRTTHESVYQVVARLVLRQQGRAPGSYAASVQSGYTVKVTVLWSSGTFEWEVRRAGKVVDMGIATLQDDGAVTTMKVVDMGKDE